MGAEAHFSDEARRGRLVARQDLAADASGPVAVARDLVILHSSDPSTPYLSCAARLEEFAAPDLDEALYEKRALWRLHAMRGTLFIATRDDAPDLLAGATRDIAQAQRRRVEQMVSTAIDSDPGAWLAPIESQILAALGEHETLTTTELAAAVPELGTQVRAGSGRWARTAPLSSRLLSLMAMDGALVRGRPAGTWRSSQYAWTSHQAWFDGTPENPDPERSRARIVTRYLERYGPATLDDIAWWTGWGKRVASAALAAAGAVEVGLESDAVALALPEDLETRPEQADESVALLPALDPTPMGWKERSWYLGDEARTALFDRNGNVGPTVWVDGWIVGGWATDEAGVVRTDVLEKISSSARKQVDANAEQLTEWLAGTPVTPRFRTPLERQLSSS